jgi:hypothetical protein
VPMGGLILGARCRKRANNSLKKASMAGLSKYARSTTDKKEVAN